MIPKRTAVKKNGEASTQNDVSAILIKHSVRILSHLRDQESRLEVLEDLLIELQKANSQKKSETSFEPIRGIHGLAQFLGVSPVTAQKLKNSGKIPFAQFDRVVLFDPVKVLTALESNYKTK